MIGTIIIVALQKIIKNPKK